MSLSLPFQNGATDKSLTLHAIDSTTFLPKTGLAYNSAGMTCYFREGATGSATALTLATLANAQAAHSDGGFVEIDATNMPGDYRLDMSDTMLNNGVGSEVVVHVKGTGALFERVHILLTADDPTAAAATVAAIADQVWNEAKADHTTAGSTGKALIDTETAAGTASSEATTGASTGLSIKAKTDSLTFTTAGIVDANVQQINDVTITGNGSTTPYGV